MPTRMLPVATPGLPDDREVRRALEAAIDRLIGLLDLMDPDPDAEPALAWAPAHDGSQIGLCAMRPGVALDAEYDVGEAERDDADLEPSLGAAIGVEDQSFWSQGAADDAEVCARRSPGVRRAVAAVESDLTALAGRLKRRGRPVVIVTGPDGGRYLLSTCQ